MQKAEISQSSYFGAFLNESYRVQDAKCRQIHQNYEAKPVWWENK